MRRAALTTGLVAVLGLACSNSKQNPPIGFSGPTAVVAYSGRTASGAVQTYLAVASSGSGDLRIVNPSDDSPIFGPGIAFALSVPTLPRPILLASASLHDDEGDAKKADLLVAASTGSLELQVMSTWTTEPLVAYTVDLSGLIGSDPGEILALAGAPVPATSTDPSGGVVVAGRARIIVALSGGRLAIVELVRQADGSIKVADGTPVLAKLDQSLVVDPVSIAVAPDNIHYYLATPDEIPATIPPTGGSRLGVVEVTASESPTDTWTLAWLDAHAPTRAVAVAMVQERKDTATDSVDPSRNDYYDPALRVYAVLDGEGCGPFEPINCGVVTLDPAVTTRTIVPDIATPQSQLGPNQPEIVPAQTYRAPVFIPGMALDIAIALPPSVASGQLRAQLSDAARFEMALAPATGQLWTSACAAVPSSDGRTYVVDLARSNTPDDVSFLASTTTTSVTKATSYAPFEAPALGLYDKAPADGGVLVEDMTTAIQVTPGYTDADTWSIIWQGQLPSLSSRPAVINQVSGTATVEIPELDLTDPSLGVHAGDFVEIVPDPASSCPASEAIVLARVLGSKTLSLELVDSCLDSALSAGPISATVTVRASGLILVGAATGYAGRPALKEPFALQWSEEDVACASDDWNCEETKVLARKARRRYYPWNPQCEGTSCVAFWPDLVTGPALAFRVGSTGIALVRDSAIVFITQSGVVPMSRQPTSGSIPTRVISLDRSVFPGREGNGTAFYVAYFGDTLFELTPGLSATEVVNIQ